jgi:hypothetical protein
MQRFKRNLAPYREVTSSKVIVDKEIDKSPMYGLAGMPDEESSKEAISRLHGKLIEVRFMSVSILKVKHE